MLLSNWDIFFVSQIKINLGANTHSGASDSTEMKKVQRKPLARSLVIKTSLPSCLLLVSF